MKENLTYVVVLLDRSGSMGSVRDSTIEGINTFIEGQKKTPGEARMTLIQFDDQYEVNYTDRLLAEVPVLTHETYQPRGSTALLDSMGRTIVELGERLAAMPESARPGRVVVVIQTDGAENCSSKFDHAQVSDMIKHQREKYNWEFIFLGANQDAIATANKFSIVNAISYNANNLSTRKLFSGTSHVLSMYRSGRAAGMSVNGTIGDSIANDDVTLESFDALLKKDANEDN